VRRTAAARTRDFEAQLPEGLELMTRCLRTGHALGAAFQMVGDEFPDPIGTEFGLVAEEIRLGLGIREALDNLTGRVENPDLPYFSTAVLIQRTGGNPPSCSTSAPCASASSSTGGFARSRRRTHGRNLPRLVAALHRRPDPWCRRSISSR
jgi:hypothetical protein